MLAKLNRSPRSKQYIAFISFLKILHNVWYSLDRPIHANLYSNTGASDIGVFKYMLC